MIEKPDNCTACRLCGSAAQSYAFSARIMESLDIGYYRCGDCGSLQTEHPHWLEQAYSLHLGDQDFGAVQRNLDNAALCLLVARLWKLKNAFDFGGGDGMLTRLVRDYGINCFLWDKYAAPVYAQGFTDPDFDRLDMLFSFEVFEHFDKPDTQLEELFRKNPAILLASTGLYFGQSASWPYLSLKSGRHIFFYSPKAMEMIATQYGYSAHVRGQYILFVRNDMPTGWRLSLFNALTRRRTIRLLRSWILSGQPFGANRDRERVRGRAVQTEMPVGQEEAGAIG